MEANKDYSGIQTSIPNPSKWNIDKDAAYFHYVDNETVEGLEFKSFPYESIGDMPLVCNMSSSIGTKSINWDKYGVVYASSQKNLGAAGVGAVVIREDLLGLAREDTPSIFNWYEYAS